MTINAPCFDDLCVFPRHSRKQGASWRNISGTLQNDILKNTSRKRNVIYPASDPPMRLITDTFRFCTEEMPKWNSISISGYHIREAGATAAQELAFTLRDGIEYVDMASVPVSR
jgi:methylmalonyl-CoA mutase N-terminal domain/subunit